MSPLGEGGMGVVFRARDTKLQRDVALKLLPDRLANDPDRLARLQREAQVLASLNHPNIAQIYGLEEFNESRCIVMEMVEGETLHERLARGPISLDEALPIARQIAEALEAAHDGGVVHRDLKPANIKLRRDGKLKVLDFGLAKVFQEQQQLTLSNSPTLLGSSAPGIILGTAAYMSPEQAKGKEADRTSDIWAFGCVLYEMLVGRAAFEGDSVTDILASVIKVGPDWSRLPSDTPESIRRLLRRCLQRDQALRLQHFGDVRIEIAEALSEPPDMRGPQEIRKRRNRTVPLAALAAGTLITTVAILLNVRSVPPAREMHFEITTPPTTDPTSLAISPDGQKIVFAATVEGRQRLWLRSLESDSPQPLAGTDAGYYPFWSPDNRSLGF